MKIAVLGTKGIPARFGGIERHCDELYPRMAARGHKVTVFVRRWYTPVTGPYKGVTLKAAPTANIKGLDAFAHTAAGSLEAMFQGFDIVHYHAIGPSLFSFMPRLSRSGTVATVHALDWQRAKWGRGARAVLKAGEWASAHFPQRTIVVSHELEKYFMEKYGRETAYIPNGVVPAKKPRASALIKELGLEPGKYILFLGRLVPEKGCHDLIEAYSGSGLQIPLVIAGGTSHSDDYVQRLRHMAADMSGSSEDSGGKGRIIFTGNVEGELHHQLSGHAALFVLPSMLEGLPIVILEMLSLGVPVLASDIAPNREALSDGEFGAIFMAGDVADLRSKLVQSLEDLGGLAKKADAGRKHVRNANDWDKIAEQTERIYKDVLAS
ncbi:MAG: glycosyltransferase family 4 protein [Thermoleophilia bacterium]|jgi:glycosyltransferase involved in cell wall biosynthesis